MSVVPPLYPQARRFAVLALGLGAVVAAPADGTVELDPLAVHAARLANLSFDAPVAVTVYEGEFLQATGIGDLQALAPLVPGFFVSAQSVDFVSYNLRGLTSDNTDTRARPRVSVFQDGVGLNSIHGNNVALFDLDNVAVFKGPQATRFGEGVQSGAIAMTSKRARDESTASLTAGAGNFNARMVEAHVNRAVVEGKLFARVAVLATERDGHVENLADGSDLQGEGTVAARASVRWKPSDATTADLILNVQRDDTPGVAFKSAVIPVSPVSTDTDPHTPANLTRGEELGVERTVLGLTGIVRRELSDAWTLTSTSAWREVDLVNEFDADGSFLYLLELGERFDGRQLSQELRLDFDEGGRWTSSLGVSGSWRRDRQRVIVRTNENTLRAFFVAPGPPPLPLNPDYSEQYENRSDVATGEVFGRADYKLTERLTVGGGLRLTREHIVSGYQSFAAPTAGNLPLLATSGGGNNFFRPTSGRLENSAHDDALAGEVDARFAVTPRMTAYASVSRGRRPRVLDFDLTTLAPRASEEEAVWNHEAGVRGFTPGRRVHYELSVFQYYFDNFQTERTVPPGVVESFDGGRARGRGFETTLRADLARELSVFANYGFTDAGFSAQDEQGNAQLYGGDSFRLTSRHVVALGGTWSVATPDAGTVFFTPIYSYRSEYFFEDDNSMSGGALRQGGHGLLNLRLGYRSRDRRWEIVFHADNVFGKKYLLDAGNIGASYGIPTNVPAAPRMVGVSATARF